MSRFNNLEFGDQFGEQEQVRSALKDGAYYLAEAQDAFARGQFEQALRAYAKVLEFEPNSAAAWTGQVRMLIELREFQEAKLWADKALEKFPEEPELLAAKAVALARIGDLKAALLFSDAAVAARSDTPYVWLARGDVLLARKERRAEFCFDKALGLAAKDWMVHWLVCRIYYFYKQFSRAFKLAQQALELNASQAVLWLQFGHCQMALGLAGAAANSFEQAQQLDAECRPSEEERLAWAEAGFWAKLRGQWRRIFQG
ncbi:MAG: tetratricopeptide repeat protein [Verrucomicrobiales bacterium]|nr:tetratricopeptide repeat protein [Verrucomicrobiales bacterium]